jgi:hypothetical protein
MTVSRQYGAPVFLAGGSDSYANAATISANDSTILSPAPQAIWANVTTAGNLALVMQGGQSMSVPVPLGVNLLPFAIQQLKLTGSILAIGWSSTPTILSIPTTN